MRDPLPMCRQISAKNQFRCSKNLTKAIDRAHRQLFKTPNGFKIEAIAKKLHSIEIYGFLYGFTMGSGYPDFQKIQKILKNGKKLRQLGANFDDLVLRAHSTDFKTV